MVRITYITNEGTRLEIDFSPNDAINTWYVALVDGKKIDKFKPFDYATISKEYDSILRACEEYYDKSEIDRG